MAVYKNIGRFPICVAECGIAIDPGVEVDLTPENLDIIAKKGWLSRLERCANSEDSIISVKKAK